MLLVLIESGQRPRPRLAELGHMDDAVTDFHEAVELAPDDVPKIASWLRVEPEQSASPPGKLLEAANQPPP